MELHDINLLECQKAVFIYNAVNSGWTVKMLNNGKYEFEKELSEVKKEVYLEDYLKKFILYNLNIDNIKVKNQE